MSEIEFFRCEECKKLRPISEIKEIKIRNVINLMYICKECFKKIGGEKKDDSKCSIGTDEGSKGEDRKV
jgi:hypothetical protein